MPNLKRFVLKKWDSQGLLLDFPAQHPWFLYTFSIKIPFKSFFTSSNLNEFALSNSFLEVLFPDGSALYQWFLYSYSSCQRILFFWKIFLLAKFQGEILHRSQFLKIFSQIIQSNVRHFFTARKIQRDLIYIRAVLKNLTQIIQPCIWNSWITIQKLVEKLNENRQAKFERNISQRSDILKAFLQIFHTIICYSITLLKV